MITTIAIGITTVLPTLLLYLWVQRFYPNKFRVTQMLAMLAILLANVYGIRFIIEAYLAGTLSVIL